MKHVKKSVLLWYSAREMYELVVAVEDYPKFLPWCESSTVLERHGADPATGAPAGMTARLGLSYAGVRQAFTTRNEQVQGESVKLKLVDGPFSQLDGVWCFKPLKQPDPTQPPPQREQAYRWRPLGRSYDPRVAIIKDTPGPIIINEIGLEATI